MTKNEVIEAAIQTIEDNDEVLSFLKLGGNIFAIGPIYSGEDRVASGQRYREKLKTSLLALHEALNDAED